MGEAQPPTGKERRATPRIDLHGELEASVELAARVLDIGLGGFSIEMPFELPQGATYKIRLTSRDGSSVVVQAIVARSKLLQEADGASRYHIGLQFTGDPDVKHSAVAFFLDKVTRAATFDPS